MQISKETKRKLLVFFIPLFIFGTGFSIFAINYVAHYPLAKATPADFIYAIYCGFADMGISFGIAALVVVSIADAVSAAWTKVIRGQEREH